MTLPVPQKVNKFTKIKTSHNYLLLAIDIGAAAPSIQYITGCTYNSIGSNGIKDIIKRSRHQSAVSPSSATEKQISNTRCSSLLLRKKSPVLSRHSKLQFRAPIKALYNARFVINYIMS